MRQILLVAYGSVDILAWCNRNVTLSWWFGDVFCKYVLRKGANFRRELFSGKTAGESCTSCIEEYLFTIEMEMLCKG